MILHAPNFRETDKYGLTGIHSEQGPGQDSEITGAKKVLNALENDTKTNIHENISGKI